MLAVASAACHRNGPEWTIPDGFRPIEAAEHSADWRRLAGTLGSPDRLDGDFDGDDQPDSARLWTRTDGTGWLLSVRLSTRGSSTIIVDEGQEDAQQRFLSLIRPGEHRTHRFYGIGPGGPDSSAVVTLSTDAINLGRVESEGTTYVWDPSAGAFRATPMY